MKKTFFIYPVILIIGVFLGYENPEIITKSKKIYKSLKRILRKCYTCSGRKKGFDCGQKAREKMDKIWKPNGIEHRMRCKGFCHKFVGLFLLVPLKISKMRTDNNITKKPNHSFIESN